MIVTPVLAHGGVLDPGRALCSGVLQAGVE